MFFENRIQELAEEHKLASTEPYGRELALQVAKLIEGGGHVSVKHIKNRVVTISQTHHRKYSNGFKIIIVNGSMQGLFSTFDSFALWLASQNDNIFALTKTNKSAMTRLDLLKAVNGSISTNDADDYLDRVFYSSKLNESDIFLYWLPKLTAYTWITVNPDFVNICEYTPGHDHPRYEVSSTEKWSPYTHCEFVAQFKENQYVKPVIDFLEALG